MSGSRMRSIVAVAPVVVAAAIVVLAAATAGCGAREPVLDDSAPVTLALARHTFAQAAEMVVAGDRAGWAVALPVGRGPHAAAVADDLADIFATLSPLPWRTFSFAVTAVDEQAGVVRVVGSGRLGDAGPPDRLAVVRYLRLRTVGDGVAIVADETPAQVRRRYMMALHDPVVVQRPGLVVLADRWAGDRATLVAAAATRVRSRLAAMGVDTCPDVLITIYGSAEDVRDSLGLDEPTARLRFFAHAPLHVGEEPWRIADVAVMGPWLRDVGPRLADILAHELAHAYTLQWFVEAGRAPSLLVEGIAGAAEGTAITPALRDEVASGNQLWPLPESFAATDVWDEARGEDVSLGYDLGASLVEYVVARWGVSALRPFVAAVAAADPSEAGMDAALGAALGVDWRGFYAGWRRYVLAGG